MHWLADVPSTVWAALITSAVLIAATRAGKGVVTPDADGWVHLRPSLVVILLGLSCVPMAAGILFSMMLTTGSVFTDPAALLVLILAAPMLVFICYVMYAFLIVGGRFNAEGFEYRGMFRTRFVSWSGISRIAYNGFWGPYAVTSRGGLLVSMYFKGFGQFLEEARGHGIEVDEGIDRARSEGQ
jgi:hypothetical protein